MTIAEKITRAKEDYAAVHAAGKQAEYDTFWDAYQNKGEPHMHHYKFAGIKWDDNTFKPKYDLKPKRGSTYTFALCYVKDLVASLKAQGRVLDTKEATDMRYFCYSMNSKTFPTLDFSGIIASDLRVQTNIFNNATNLETIEKIILQDGLVFSGWFTSCRALKNVTFEGNIGNDITFKDSPLLSGDSIVNIIGCLSDTATGKTLTLSKTAVENAFPSEEAIEFYPDNETATDNGYTFTVNDNGSITINGTGDQSEPADGFFDYNISLPLPKGIYEFSLPSDTDSDNLYAYYEVYAPTYPLADVFVFPNNTQTVAIEDDEACALLSLIVSGGSTVDNITVKPTIKRIVAWDELAATKPNWTISLV